MTWFTQTPPGRHVARLWSLVDEPRLFRVIMTLAYGVFGGGGVYGIIYPPLSISAALGPFYTTVWVWTLALGGAVGLFFTLRRVWEFERVALVALMVAFLLYWLAVVFSVAFEPGRGLQAFVLGGTILLLLARLVYIKGSFYEPGA